MSPISRKQRVKKVDRNLVDITYWSIPFFLLIFQAIFTFNSLNQIRYEELAEAVRNPFWLEHGFIYDAISSNVGWYAILLLTYKLLGFGLFGAKYVRLVLSLISLICLAAILKKYLKRAAWIPLIAIGLSPTILYFNTLSAQFGIDLVYLPICLFLITKTGSSGFSSLLAALGSGTVAMIAWMSYPTFIYFLPALVLFFIYKNIKNKKHLFVGLFAFLLPLVLSFFYIKNSEMLLGDSSGKFGLFRGGGAFSADSKVFVGNLNVNITNLFLRPGGYNFELYSSEFSGVYPVLTIIASFCCLAALWRVKKGFRFLILAILSVLVLNILVAYFSLDPYGGLRRTTGILAAIYGVYTLSWFFVSNLGQKGLRYLGMFLLVLLPLHHLLVFGPNLLHLSDPSQFAERQWFALAGSPKQSLALMLGRVQSTGLDLACQNEKGEMVECRYSEIFAAVEGSCLWNKLSCKSINGYDWKRKEFIPLNVDLWNTYYFEH